MDKTTFFVILSYFFNSSMIVQIMRALVTKTTNFFKEFCMDLHC
jgi:hypothetical protein